MAPFFVAEWTENMLGGGGNLEQIMCSSIRF